MGEEETQPSVKYASLPAHQRTLVDTVRRRARASNHAAVVLDGVRADYKAAVANALRNGVEASYLAEVLGISAARVRQIEREHYAGAAKRRQAEEQAALS